MFQDNDKLYENTRTNYGKKKMWLYTPNTSRLKTQQIIIVQQQWKGKKVERIRKSLNRENGGAQLKRTKDASRINVIAD